MEKNVLTALWNKINDTFPTKGDLAASLIPKLDITTYNQDEESRVQAEIARQEAESARTTTFSSLSAAMETSIDSAISASNSAHSAADIAISAANRVDSAITQAERVDAELSGSVVTITNKEGISRSIDLAATTDEAVWITVSTSVVGVDVSGLTINVYYNGASTPTTAVTTDENGMAVLYVPNTYTYKLVFPSIQGCVDIAPVTHVATLSQRSVEVEYVEYIPGQNVEEVTVLVQEYAGQTATNVSGLTVTLTISGNSTQYVTNSSGKVVINVDLGSQYSISVPNREGYYVSPMNTQTQSFTAESSKRGVLFIYRNAITGIFVVHENGSEYNILEWEDAVSAGTVTNSQAKLIKVATNQLADNDGIFAVLIDHLRERTYGANAAWNPDNVQFNSIPLNGNSASQPYYYDGMTASVLIQKEGDERGLQTPAVDKCLAMTQTIGEGENEQTLKGFLGSVGQWNILWGNRVEIDNILTSTRPEGTYLLSTLTTNKWTSTQHSAFNAWHWTTAADVGDKGSSFTVVPFFAF